MPNCVICGEQSDRWCGKCGRDICLPDTRYYVDEANIAITRNALPECTICSPPKFPRPYTWTRAVAQGEWELDWFPPGQEPLVRRP